MGGDELDKIQKASTMVSFLQYCLETMSYTLFTECFAQKRIDLNSDKIMKDWIEENPQELEHPNGDILTEFLIKMDLQNASKPGNCI